VTACASLPLPTADLAEGLRRLGEQLRLKTVEHCVAGLSLSSVSLRNLSLPFADEKKIGQILPFELEEQLLLPVDEQVIATVASAASVSGTALLVAAAEKSLLRSLLEAFQQAGLKEPDTICPAIYLLADRLCRTDHAGNTFLLLHVDVSSVQIALARQGETVFMRRLAWPDTVFTHVLFRQEIDGIAVDDPTAAAEAFASICELTRQSLDYFALQSGMEGIEPDYFILAGPLQACPGLQGALETRLELSGKLCDLVRDGAASLTAAGQWQVAVYDKALALALHQAGRRGKEAGLNFRQGEFAPARHLLRSKRQIAALAAGVALLLLACCGWLLVEHRRLEKKQSQLAAKMEKVFQESFPGVKAGPDPLMHMRSRRKSMAASPTAMPIFSNEKRALALLADISARIPTSIQMQVERLVIDQNTVSIRGVTDAFNNVNLMQSLLGKSGRYAEVKIVSAAKGKQGEGILFEIKLQLKTEVDS
jgi:general secretion pathway protein L